MNELYGRQLTHAEPHQRGKARQHGLVGKTLAEAIACCKSNGATLRVYDYANRPLSPHKPCEGDFVVKVRVVDGRVTKAN